MLSLVRLVQQLPLHLIDVPTFMAYSPNDQTVDPDEIERRFNTFTAHPKELASFDKPGSPNNHVIAGRILAPGNTAAVLTRIVGFMNSLPADPVQEKTAKN